ncbi:exodeoxyribonuclease VII large subunit [Eubacterium xylanophilum]|uniref:exodeoxyribonuclease VII large subunit n=1 Tax=Eubacterium xylanophilum TaxID=39497 RepID=UPI00047AE3E7|nr:exodeoxyribonuclease VII large subunit [Eubacterium xylanophilum]
MDNRQKVYSVTDINKYIKNMFIEEYALSVVFVKGEVSNCKYHSSGHIYFTVKDSMSSMPCVMFAGDRRAGLNFKMNNGDEVIIGGSISVYERDGRYQLYAKRIVLDGTGVLYEKYEKLKKQLLAEGLFDEAKKKPIPRYVKKVGIVTAETGAAIQDIINISTRRNPYVQLYLRPALVQGEGAASSVAAGIRFLDEYGVDVIIVGRGGGSIEDLWAFNEEEVARAIYECETPIISAVGHETDTTIADYVSDRRAPTPSAAAEIAVYDVNQVLDQISFYDGRIKRSMLDIIDIERQKVDMNLKKLMLLNPSAQIAEKQQTVENIKFRMITAMDRILEQNKQRVMVLAKQLDGLSPLKRLESGYSFCSDMDGRCIDSINLVKPGDKMKIEVKDGTIYTNVENVEEIYGAGTDNGTAD